MLGTGYARVLRPALFRAYGGDPERVAHEAIQMLFSLRRRLELLVSLPLHGGDRAAVRSDVRDLGYMR